MYDIDPKFLNEDGSINYETALRAGRSAHARNAAATMAGLSVVMKRVRRREGRRAG